MNELQLGLIGAGAVIVVAVVAFNNVQARRARRGLPRTMPDDGELGAHSTPDNEDEPFIVSQRRPAWTTPADAASRREPGTVDGADATAAESPSMTDVSGASTPRDNAAVAVSDEPAASSGIAFRATSPRVRSSDPAAPDMASAGGNGQERGKRTLDKRGSVPDRDYARREPTFGGLSEPAGATSAAEGEADEAPHFIASADPAAMPAAAYGGEYAEGVSASGTPEAVLAADAITPGTTAASAGAAVRADMTVTPEAAGAPEAPEAATTAGRVTAPGDGSAMPGAAPADRAEAVDVPASVVDRRIDCVVDLELGDVVAAERVMPLAIRFRRAGSKPVTIEGRDEAGRWGPLQSGMRYRDLRAAVQLANRSGALNELEFSEFVAGVHRLADALDAAATFPEMAEVVQMARELDQFAAQCDAQLSINVLSDSAPWSGSYVQAVASNDGLLLSRDGTRFVQLDVKRNPVFTMSFEGTNFLRDDLTYKGGHMITLLLDVPVADEDILPWRLMCDYARSLAERIGARVVDDQRRLLPDDALVAIDDRLMGLYARLDSAGLPAGSAVARRLFSS